MRLGAAKVMEVTVHDDRGRRSLFSLLRSLHKEASRFIKEQGGFKRIKLQLKISVRKDSE